MRILRLASLIWAGVLLVLVLASLLVLGARFFILPQQSAPPVVLATIPAAGARDVSPRATISIQFSDSMNPPSVEHALRIEPAVAFDRAWDPLRATLILTPATTLQPGTRYRLTIDESALGRSFSPLQEPFSLVFDTAPAPAVITVLPNDGSIDVPLDTLLSVRFSRPIAALDMLGRFGALPELRFEPPLAGSATWLDSATLLFRPATSLRPGVRYRVVLAPELTDQNGGQLGREYSWSFTTRAPSVREVAPLPNARQVAPRAPLRIVLSHPVDERALERALSISPALSGALETALLPNGTQVVTYTPSVDWQPGVAYTIALPAILPDGTPLLAAPYRWSFAAAPRPALIGRFPGEGQLLPPGRDIRLIFSTPVDADLLRDTLQIEPPVSDLRVTANDGEVRLDVQLQAATLYTMTIPASFSDRAGVVLGRDYQVRFYTTPSLPVLALPEAQGRIITVADAPVELLVRRTNLSELRFALYPLDDATLLRALGFSDADWAAFDPARYGLAPLRSWNIPLTDPLNTMVEERIALEAETPLPPGFYLVRVRSPENTGADIMLVVSRAALSLQVTGNRALVWATDTLSATVLPDVPLTLYQQGVLIGIGRSNADGLWEVMLPTVSQRGLVALSGGDRPALALAEAGTTITPAPRYTLRLATDRDVYAPGDEIRISGFIRQVELTMLAPPPPGLPLRLSARGPEGARLDAHGTIDAAGVISASLQLPADALPGSYLLTTPFNPQESIAIQVHPPAPPLQLTLTSELAGESAELMLTARTAADLPVAGAIVTWTINAEPRPLPAFPGFIFGIQEATTPTARAGAGMTDATGQLTIDAATLQDASWTRYRLRARVTEPGGPVATLEQLLDAPPAPAIGLRLPRRFVAAGADLTLEALAIGGIEPLAAQALQLEAFRRDPSAATSGASPTDERVLNRRIVTGADGRANATITLREPGEYQIRLTAADAAITPVEARLWVYEAGFVAWYPSTAGDALLADRSEYKPGETAELLPIIDLPDGPALLTVYRARGTETELRQIRAGEPLTLTLTAEDAPETRVTLTPAPRSGASRVRLSAILPLPLDTPPLTTTLVTAAETYTPGATATFTLTVAGPDGIGVPADVLLRALGSDTGETPLLWRSVRTAANGVLQFSLLLPANAGDVIVSAWVAGTDRFGAASARIRVEQPLTVRLIAPPVVRAGDEVDLLARLESATLVTQEVRLAFDLPAGAATLTTVTIAPETVATVRIPLTAPLAANVNVTATAVTAGTAPLALSAPLAILPPATTIISGSGALVQNQLATTIDVPVEARAGWGALEVEVAPSLDILATSLARDVSLQPTRDTLDNAAILLLGSPLAEVRAEVVDARQRLVATQTNTGGWNWRQDPTTDPAVTAIVLEALAAGDIGDPPVAITLDRALLEAARLARDPATPLDARACLIYALGRHGYADSEPLTIESAGPLSPNGLACRLLSLPPAEARADAALARLIALARRDATGAWWAKPANGVMPHGNVATTALATLALRHAAPEDPLAIEAAGWLIRQYQPGGWGDAYTTARVIQTLRAILPAVPATGVTLALNGALVTIPDTLDSALRTIPIPLAELRPTNTLVVTSSGGPVLVAWRLTWTAPQPTGGAGLIREYVDPRTGALLNPAAFQPGQLVEVRLALVVPAEQRYVTIRDATPAGFVLVEALPDTVFSYVAASGGQLELSSAALPAGIYQYSYLARAVHTGRYAAPPPEIILPGGQHLPGVATAIEVGIR